MACMTKNPSFLDIEKNLVTDRRTDRQIDPLIEIEDTSDKLIIITGYGSTGYVPTSYGPSGYRATGYVPTNGTTDRWTDAKLLEPGH